MKEIQDDSLDMEGGEISLKEQSDDENKGRIEN